MNLEKVLGMVKSVLMMLAPGLKSADSAHGVKEFRELLKGCLSLALFMVKKFKDGVDFSDFTEFYSALTQDGEFKDTMKAAYDGYQKVGAELKDIDAGEGLEVGCDVLDFVDDFALALKKEEKEEEASSEDSSDDSSDDSSSDDSAAEEAVEEAPAEEEVAEEEVAEEESSSEESESEAVEEAPEEEAEEGK